MYASVVLVAAMAFLRLLCTLPLASADAGDCSGGYCKLDYSASCAACATNASYCAAAWYDSAGAYCGQQVETSQQSGRQYVYPACCPVSYPCKANSYVYSDGGDTFDVSSFWCYSSSASQSTTGTSSGTQLTWLWWLLASAGASALFYLAMFLYRRRQSRLGLAAQQQQGGGEPQQELSGRLGPWNEEAQQQQQQPYRPAHHHPAVQYAAYQPPAGTYAQMP